MPNLVNAKAKSISSQSMCGDGDPSGSDWKIVDCVKANQFAYLSAGWPMLWLALTRVRSAAIDRGCGIA
jgi:hypothetical protein